MKQKIDPELQKFIYKVRAVFRNNNRDLVRKMMEDGVIWEEAEVETVYSCDWTDTLRRSIRERDNYACQLCGKLQGDRAFAVHHIDYDKKNCDPNNLITLCHSCHTKTNCIDKKYWIELLTKKVNENLPRINGHSEESF